MTINSEIGANTFTMSEIVTATAASFNVTLEELARDIFAVASYIEEMGNRGVSRGLLSTIHNRGGKYVPVYFLERDASPVLNGILFEMREGRYRDKSRGWMVRKEPHWKQVWASRFCLYYSGAREVFDQLKTEETTRAEADKARPQRLKTRFAQGEYEKFSTLQIGERWAAATILYKQAVELFVTSSFSPDASKDDMHNNLYGYTRQLWQQEAADFEGELQFRRQLGDDLAGEILNKGASYFYTRETIAAMASSREQPRFVLYNGAPYDDTNYTPAMTDFQVTRRFVELVDPDGKSNSRYGDKQVQALLAILRKQLKNLKEDQF